MIDPDAPYPIGIVYSHSDMRLRVNPRCLTAVPITVLVLPGFDDPDTQGWHRARSHRPSPRFLKLIEDTRRRYPDPLDFGGHGNGG